MDTDQTALPAPSPPVSPRAIRWIELGLLLAVAFGGSIYRTAAQALGITLLEPTGPYNWQFALVHDLTALGLCAYLLHKQGRSFRNLGLTANRADFLWWAAILIVQFVVTKLVTRVLYANGYYSSTDYATHQTVVGRFFGPHLVWGMLLLQVVNAFYEELIVRAYLMTDLTFLTGKPFLAVATSAVFQGAYHLYQGWQAALSITAGFVVFSLFYARFHRITPIIITHVIWDVWWYVGHYLWHASSGQRIGHP